MRELLLAVALMLSMTACQTPPGLNPSESAVIFFNENSSALDSQASAIITRVASMAQTTPKAIVHVLGFASSDYGSVEYNQSLSQKRAAAVVDGLEEAGIDRARIHIEPVGGVPFELTPVESRRVEITIGG